MEVVEKVESDEDTEDALIGGDIVGIEISYFLRFSFLASCQSV